MERERFGADHGLVSEAIVTLRKVAPPDDLRTFFSYLAHDESLCRSTVARVLKEKESVPVPPARFTVDTSEPSDKKDRCVSHRSLGTVEVLFEDGEMYVDRGRIGFYRFPIPPDWHEGVVVNLKRWWRWRRLLNKMQAQAVLPDAILPLLVKEKDCAAVAAFLAKYHFEGMYCWGTVYTDPYNHSPGMISCLYRGRNRECFVAQESLTSHGVATGGALILGPRR